MEKEGESREAGGGKREREREGRKVGGSEAIMRCNSMASYASLIARCVNNDE